MTQTHPNVETFIAVRDLLSDEKKWTKGVSARNKEGKQVNCLSEDATSWCLSGALEYILKDDHHWNGYRKELVHSLYTHSILYYANQTVVEYNDHEQTTHEDILHILDKTINRMKSAQKP